MRRCSVIAIACLALVFASVGSPAAAQQTNTQERTFLTFSSPVELPGVTLPAGTYVFKLADTPSRNVVQVYNEDEDEILGQWLFVQRERPEVTDETVIMFQEEREGATPAVQFWYFPGEKIGKEFVYPEDQAQRIAARTGQDVLTLEGEIEGDATVFSVDAAGKRTPYAAAGAAGRNVTFTGCVYQASDQPALFAVRRMESAAPAGGDRVVGTTGADAAGAWYRLGMRAQNDLSRYVGQRVQVTGELTPGRDERGADVVVHRIQPDRVTVTALDLKPAPELSINTIVPMAGTCDPAPAAAR